MLKKVIIFSFLYLIFSFSHASIVDPYKGKDLEKEQQKCKKKYAAAVEGETVEFPLEQTLEERQPETLNEEEKQEVSSKQEQKNNVHSFNFLYYLIHHYKFSDFITQ
jgi:hypothetical protein